MNNAPAILRSLIIYMVCVPLAFFVGYLLTNPLDYSTFAIFGVMALILIFPLLLRYHYAWLVFSWCGPVTLFFLKGAPSLFMAMVAISLGISVLERILNPERHFIRVPQITWPLIFMLAVVMFTAKLTGGFGLRTFGSEVYGGKKYISLIIGILSYFALTARRIPPAKARLYVALYFLGGVVVAIGDLYPLTPSFMRPIFWFIPPDWTVGEALEFGVTRVGGIVFAGFATICWLFARYGITGVFLTGKLWRKGLFAIAFVSIVMGGYRSKLLGIGMIFLVLFFVEGLHRTRALLVFVMAGMLGVVIVIPLTSHLPFTFQRTLAFLPLNISTEAREAAKDSSEWRVKMWTGLLPQLPKYILLGEGYAITMEDFQMMGSTSAFKAVDPGQQALALSRDFHNGPLSVILPFGIWGVIGFVWFVAAGFPVVYRNYRYGDPALRTINTFMWVHYMYLCFAFVIIGGSLPLDIMLFCGDLGLSIALNNGVCRPAPEAIKVKSPASLTKPFPRPRPVFQR